MGLNYERWKVDDWNNEAKRSLKTELALRQISNKELLRKLEEMGITDETERSLASKISRGTFSYGFFIKCMRAVGATEVDITGKPVTSVKRG